LHFRLAVFRYEPRSDAHTRPAAALHALQPMQW
jgi:hypothetical protein